ncbi:acyl carrier protein [Streptomyces glomeratus]|uniref:Carrier domain-containing protein n=1 Tax=Streptomyces glomeratus TaxID=284452 RepID=A0ABP6M0Y1_9ACTN|nr:acyl carrier protein [Streptomyces glomeratus]MCF1512464.1 acyl carrier protein [Streptomyces glomeratus]
MADNAGNKAAIREFILENISESTVRDDEDIFERGLVRSMFVMQLVLFVEQEFGVSITGEDLQFDNFRTVDRIDELVSRKLAAV